MNAPTDPFEADITASSGELDLTRVRTTDELLREAGAAEVLGLLQRLGFWVGSGAANTAPAHTFNHQLANLTPVQLGNEAGYWQSELSRVTAVLGALRGQERLVKYKIKRARDTAAAAVIRAAQAEKAKVPTAAHLGVLISERPEVVRLERGVALLESVTITFDATREAIDGYCRVLSREMTRRGDMMRAGIG